MFQTIPSLDGKLCRQRQDRLRSYLSENDFDAAVFFNRHYVYALSGYWHEQPLTPTAIFVEASGGTTIFTHEESPNAPAADKNVTYVPNHLFTLKPNLSGCLTQELNPLLRGLRRVATGEQTPAALLENVSAEDISEDYQYIRRKKDSDEVAAFLFTIECADKAYAEALQIIEPGVSEVEVMASMQEAAVFHAGEFLSGWGQDFQCGAPGGFARPHRLIEDGELYVLDVGVGVRGYRSDLCRTFSVNGSPTDEQAAAHAKILEVMEQGEKMLKPGQSCHDMYDFVYGELDGWNGYQFFHHAGHGVGLDAHEVPRINPKWRDNFEEGDLVAFEPGLYGESLRGGIRLENNYLITSEGNQQLSHFPLSMTACSS